MLTMSNNKFLAFSLLIFTIGFAIKVLDTKPRDPTPKIKMVKKTFPGGRVYRFSSTSSSTIWWVVDSCGDLYEVHTTNQNDPRITAIRKGIPQ